MKKLGATLVLMLLFAFASSAGAADRQLTVVNDSAATVTVSILWSGGGLDPVKLEPGERESVGVPANLDSVKAMITGRCREARETFNPQRVTLATIRCQDNVYTVLLAVTKPAAPSD
jgi:hypothetical protein